MGAVFLESHFWRELHTPLETETCPVSGYPPSGAGHFSHSCCSSSRSAAQLDSYVLRHLINVIFNLERLQRRNDANVTGVRGGGRRG